MNWSERYAGKIKPEHQQLVDTFKRDLSYASYPTEDGGSFTNTVEGHMGIHNVAKQHANILYNAQKSATGDARNFLWKHYLEAQNYANSAKKSAEDLAKPQLF